MINLCIHADYSENATLIVRLFKNRMVFSNPGTMLVSKQQYYTGGDSVCRNKALQTMFMMLGTAEKAGSGVDKILKGWKESNWRSPIIDTKCQPDKVELTMSMETIMDDEIKERLIELFGEAILNVGHNRLLVLNIACADGFVSNESVRFVLNKHKFEIADFLKGMCKDGLLVSVGYGRGTKYRLPSDCNVATSETKVATSETKVATSETKVATSETKVATSEVKVATSETKVATLDIKKRLSKSQLYDLILECCEDWRTMEEIAFAVNRDQKYVRGKILPIMLKEKMVEMLFPGVPNHPRQKYKRK